jgi:hypothetical protein
LVNWQYLLCTETWRHSKLARRSCKIRREEHPIAFVRVVEGSEIYNFPIHHSVHFSCNNSSYGQSNRDSPKSSGTSRRIASAGARQVTPQPPTCLAARGRAFPKPSAPQDASSAAPRVAPSSPPVRRQTAVLCPVRRRPLRAHWPRRVAVRGVMPGTHHDAPSRGQPAIKATCPPAVRAQADGLPPAPVKAAAASPQAPAGCTPNRGSLHLP